MKKIQLDLNDVKNKRQLKEALDDVMDFSGWYGPRLDEWIDLVSMFDSPNHAIKHFNAKHDEHFVLELAGSQTFAEVKYILMRTLLQHINVINLRYIERFNKPIISVTFM